ncbi:hypothetical protein Lal_00016077 [Lupinus albus]|nr:hypothetical protein Lal_00016077 [Lupinus albus]
MYDRIKVSMGTQDGFLEDIPIDIELHQGSTLSINLFTLVLDIQQPMTQCIGRLKREIKWEVRNVEIKFRNTWILNQLEQGEVRKCKSSKKKTNPTVEVKIEDHIIPQVIRFMYLGSTGEADEDVNHRIQTGLIKWQRASDIICD